MRKDGTTFQERCCRDLGHQWGNTTSAVWRKCERYGCHLVQRLDHGMWVDVVTTAKKTIVVEQEQAALWGGGV